MTPGSAKFILFTIFFISMILAAVLFVVFGQFTVRKLRKNPKTKDKLGMEFMSCWDILNVAGALALPRWLNRKLRNTPFPSMYANAEILDKHTSLFDRVLATVFYILWVGSFSVLLIFMLSDHLGVFE